MPIANDPDSFSFVSFSDNPNGTIVTMPFSVLQIIADRRPFDLEPSLANQFRHRIELHGYRRQRVTMGHAARVIQRAYRMHLPHVRRGAERLAQTYGPRFLGLDVEDEGRRAMSFGALFGTLSSESNVRSIIDTRFPHLAFLRPRSADLIRALSGPATHTVYINDTEIEITGNPTYRFATPRLTLRLAEDYLRFFSCII